MTVLQERADLQAVLDVTDRCRRTGALVVAELHAVAPGRPLAHAVDLSRFGRAATP